ncbi:hypothetical protein LSH36_13g08021 [Paralvinella palmiformis]|uniref:40S ribosomal protein S27 n=1 Tax=Paralvinella palmiformis TaxID=53620 RepID=A0AAD9NG87_9ANNE|nr:hypothetical protein LSH36_13g08021 [Paralvinella palmiformis]
MSGARLLRVCDDVNVLSDTSEICFSSRFDTKQHGRRLSIAPLARDLLNPSLEEEKRKCKLKRLVQSPNSYFMDVKCPGCYKITTVFSHAQTVVLCVGCSTVLCQPTGGKARLTEAFSIWGLDLAIISSGVSYESTSSAPFQWMFIQKKAALNRLLLEHFDEAVAVTL